MKWWIKILRWVWEFPQCLLGLILTHCYNVKRKEVFKDIPIYAGSFPGGISLGLYILMDEYKYSYNRNYIKEHEWGHTRQSLYLGWLYLPIVGLSSGVWCLIRKYSYKLRKIDYYTFWCEAWADKLGRVRR